MAPKKRKAVAAKAEPPAKKAAKVEVEAPSVGAAGGGSGVVIEAWYAKLGEVALFTSCCVPSFDIVLKELCSMSAANPEARLRRVQRKWRSCWLPRCQT